MELQTGSVLKKRYEIKELLGKGGMGAVYLAHDNALDSDVAVKSNQNISETSGLQFLKEAQLLASLRHPNLPRVIDHFIEGEIQYLVMDYIPGKDLDTIMEEQGAQPLETVLKWAHQLGSALKYLHRQDPPVIHRDIKPANVKITPEGDIFLVDFGLAKAAASTQQTATGALGYTPGYAPPEQYGGAHTGPYSDQYSFAATLYKLLSNQQPSESIQILLGNATLTPLKLLVPGLPQHVITSINRAMSLQIGDRFSGVGDFIRSLEDPNYSAETQSPQTVAHQRPQANPDAVTQVINPRTAQPTLQSPQQPISQPAPKKKKGLVIGILVALILLSIPVLGGGAWYLFFRSTPTPHAVIIDDTQAVSQAGNVDAETPHVEATHTTSPTIPLTPTETATPTPEPTATNTPEPKLLVDERKVVFVSNRADGQTYQLWTMVIVQDNNQLVGTGLTQLTFDEGDKFEPEWSPDGKQIIYSSAGQAEGNKQIWLLDASEAESQPMRLTDLSGENTNPSWASDNSKIAFANFGRYTEVYAVYTINPDGSGLERISADFQEFSPFWSPDMKYFLHMTKINDLERLYIRDKNTNINYTTPEPDYNRPNQFHRFEDFTGPGNIADPVFSFDGTYIAFTRVNDDGKRIEITEFASRGNDVTIMTIDQTQEYEPAWSPDSQWLIFTSDRDGNQEIYIMNSLGNIQTNLTNDPASDMQADWQH